MSFQRTRLRAAWVALLTNGGTAPYPTLAGERVYDSRIGLIQQAAENQMLPFIAVYTDNDQRTQLSPMAPGGGVFKRSIDVVIELAVGTWTVGENDEATFVAPQTDAELELILDSLEMQLWLAYFNGANAHAIALQKLVKNIQGWDSRPGRAEGNAKISARQLTITCEVTDDTRGGECPMTLASIFPTYLSALLESIQSDPAYASLAEALELVTGETIPEPMEPIAGFNVKVDYINHSTQAPDGTIDIEGDWPTPTEE